MPQPRQIYVDTLSRRERSWGRARRRGNRWLGRPAILGLVVLAATVLSVLRV
jgi:hypothetical protein